MSNLFGFSFFSTDVTETDASEPVPPDVTEKDAPEPVPPERDRSLSSQFFSYFGEESPQEDEEKDVQAPPAPASAVLEIPAPWTLSGMAQKMTDYADDAIRSITPEPNRVLETKAGRENKKNSVEKKESGKLSDIADENKAGVQYKSNKEDKFPSYQRTKPAQNVPLLAFSKTRDSFIDRDKKIIGIAETTKAIATDQFTVTNHTGLPNKKSPVVLEKTAHKLLVNDTIIEETDETKEGVKKATHTVKAANETAVVEELTTIEEVAENSNVVRRYESEDFLDEQTEDEPNEDIITGTEGDVGFSRSVSASQLEEVSNSYSPCRDEETLNLIGTAITTD